MTTAPEPKDKLDAMTVQLDADADAARIMNGPKGDVLDVDWDAIDWRAQENIVRRLRQRIFTATRDGDWATVQDLPKLMLRSLSNTLVSVRQVTQHP
jgi:RNA-directed DNA polymerase